MELDRLPELADQGLTLEEIRAELGLATNALKLECKRLLGMTLGAYVRQRRLQQAHADLATGNPKSVTEVALSLGFTEIGRFAGLYREAFGESPSETLRNARGQVDKSPAIGSR